MAGSEIKTGAIVLIIIKEGTANLPPYFFGVVTGELPNGNAQVATDLKLPEARRVELPFHRLIRVGELKPGATIQESLILDTVVAGLVEKIRSLRQQIKELEAAT